MICFGTRRNRRVGRHRFSLIGRSTAYGKRLFQIRLCIYCEKASVTG